VEEHMVEHGTCRVCGGNLESVLDLGNLYLSNFVPQVDETLPKAPLHLMRCTGCNLGQLSHTANPDLSFRQYWYQSGINESMRSSLRDVIANASVYKQEGVWVDIGANDGYLLGQTKNFYRIGVEPSLNLVPDLASKADEVMTDYFPTRRPLSHKADVITSIAMFYDVEAPLRFVQEVRDFLTPDGIWINQLSYTPEMLRVLAFDNICHEHLTYWSLAGLRALYARAGLKLMDFSFNSTNGGSVRTVACRDDCVRWPTCTKTITEETDWARFAQRALAWKDEFKYRFTINLHPYKDIYLYGASTKGNTLLQFLDVDVTRKRSFKGAADRNESKFGLKMVGSWVPIVSEEEARAKAGYFLVLPWAFKEQMVEREQEFLSKGGRLIFPLPNIEVIV
jgi:SAM-dependent methyltransferase